MLLVIAYILAFVIPFFLCSIVLSSVVCLTVP